MIQRIIILIVVMLFIAILPLSAKNDSGKNIIQFGDSASSLGRGGTGVSASGAELFYLNPASIAPLERLEFGLQYGTLGPRYSNPDITFAIPSSYGVFGGSWRMISIPSDSNDIERGNLFSLGAAKNFTDRLMFGAALNYFYGQDKSENLAYTGITIGSLYSINFETNIKRGFGIFEPKIGASVNAGIPWGDHKKYANFNQATFGYNFLFYKSRDLNIKLYNDVSAINAYNDFPVKFGLESLIKNKYIARAGFTVPQSYEYGDYTLGLGYLFNTEELDFDVNYSLAHYSKLNFIHYAGINIRYGKLDTEPPVTKIKASEEFISPNYDGKMDYVIFKPEVEDKSRIKGWKLQVMNSGGSVVKEYRISERDIDQGLSFKGFFMKVWQKKESMVVPESILWDGTDSGTKTVPDGLYTYSFIAWDERENISSAKKGIIHVDGTSPEVTLESGSLFSPNGDSTKDSLDIKLNIATSAEDIWTAGFSNSDGKPVKSYKWNGSEVPKKIMWNGKDDNGVEAPEGLYNFYISSVDKAGNSSRADKKEITLTRKYQTADITCSNEYFTYKENKSVIFYPVLSDKKGLEKWKISIITDGAKVIKEIEGTESLPGTVIWTVLDTKEKQLDDDKYYFRFSAEYNSGNKPASFLKEIIIDSTSPKVSLNYSPSLFSPDGDGENDVLFIDPEAVDKDGSIKEWTLDVIAPSGKIFKSFSGKNSPPSVINWDGTGKDKDLVESAADYFLAFSAKDMAGNAAKTDRVKVPVDVLVTVTERGLKIRISNIEFAFDKAILTGKAFPILNRVKEILNKYNKYNVLIEGHTDDIGEEEYNLKLSEERAKTVMDYLISKGIDEKRLTFRGIGEIMPFLPNTDNDNKRRNRRVEFLLLKEAPNK